MIGGGLGGSGGARRRREDDRAPDRDVFDDGQDWIDDEGAGPGVLG